MSCSTRVVRNDCYQSSVWHLSQMPRLNFPQQPLQLLIAPRLHSGNDVYQGAAAF